MGATTAAEVVLVLRSVIKWQAIPKGLADPSRDHLEQLLRSPLNIRKALSIGDLRYWLCCKLSVRGSQFRGGFGLCVTGFKGRLETNRDVFITLRGSVCEYHYTY